MALLKKYKYALHSLSLVLMMLSAILMYSSAQKQAYVTLMAWLLVFALVNGLLLCINN